LRTITRERLQERCVGPSCRDVALLHGHIIANGLLADFSLDGVYEVQEANFVGIANIDDPERRGGAQAVAWRNVFDLFGALWDCINEAGDAADEVFDISEVAPHLAIIVDVDRFSIDDVPHKFEVGHVWPAPRPVDREEAEHGDRQVVDMRVAVAHRLIGELRCRIEGERVATRSVSVKGISVLAP